ncbi:glycosyltransferase family 4 protein [Acidianus sp. HS-5]|uniref:glycosyltransferase family 4 protein n=1 Tax=Acidianus sp. HS-5 TaxID=2886040 RepID=UPI001F2BD56C|nr:glycosyltransferase family 4 protein [Acidianus sp. HS-5]BDC18432.1 glycosyl transferase family 1 [Acidianus sp. HS-5]
MKVTIVAHNLSNKSGEGSVVFSSIEMLKEKRVDFVVSTFSKPKENQDIPVKYYIPFNFSRLDRYQRLLVWLSARKIETDIYLNFTGIPIPLSSRGIHIIYGGASPFEVSKYSKSLFWRLYRFPFKVSLKFLKNESKKAKFVANSFYSANTWKKLYGIEAKVIYPPVDVEEYFKAFHEGGKYILTIARIERGKFLERTIQLSYRVGLPAVIVGYLSDEKYYKELLSLKSKLNADVTFILNASREQLIQTMKEACCYFHPTQGEHFGIPVVESMAAGLIPVVPIESGAAEIVPEFAYSTLEEAESKIKEAYVKHSYKSYEMKEIASKFSKNRFKEEFWEYVVSVYNEEKNS